jgi:phage tail-like protein
MDERAMITNFNFLVEIECSGYRGDENLAATRSGGAFSDVQGLEISLEPVTIREGGYNLGPRQLIGKTSTQPLILKRGVSRDQAFWTWIQSCLDGTFPLPYVSGNIRAYPPEGQLGDPISWRFTNGIVTKVLSAPMNAKGGGEVPLEELHIVHEGLSRIT